MILVEVRKAVIEENWRIHIVWNGKCEDALGCVLYSGVYDASRSVLVCGGDGSPAPCRRIWLIGVARVLPEVHRYEVRWHR